ncbi:MAG: DUF3098 domain-containing protein [Flavobacteriaceae bacterium]|nr:DUF3098 domain-containing protein [Flavobacteriaceae bacterium]
MKNNNMKKTKNKPEFLFEKKNYQVMLIGLVFIAVGFVLMSGGGSDNAEEFNPDIYNFQRIRLAPLLILIGFGIEIYAIILKAKK